MTKHFPSQNAAILAAELRNYTGDFERYRHSLNRRLVYTLGARQLFRRAEAYWLLDAIATWVGSPAYHAAVRLDPRVEELHFWLLDVRDDHSAVLTARVDSGIPPFVTQEIEYTDFCLQSIDLWCALDGERFTLYLPSEH